MTLKNSLYAALRFSNDVRAVRKGRILERLWNRLVGRTARRFMK